MGPPLHAWNGKLWVVVVRGTGLQDFSVSTRPLGFGCLGLGLRGLGPGLDIKQANPTAVLYSYLVEPWHLL